MTDQRPIMLRMAHGYTNDTTGDGTVVVKRYAGPGAEIRLALERGVLARLQGLLPVPPVLCHQCWTASRRDFARSGLG